MRRVSLFVLFVLLAVGTIFAHDKGDLMLNIEPQIGYAFPIIEAEVFNIPGKDYLSAGFDFGLMSTVHYYFTDYIGVNTGFGVSGFLSYFSVENKAYEDYNMSAFFATLYFTIPVGVRFSHKALAIGAGVTANFPISGSSSSIVFFDNNGEIESEIDKNFKLKTNIGWYADVGFDLSGINNRKGGFGMLGRFSGSFNNIAQTDLPYFEYDPFRYFAFSIVFQIGIELTNTQK